MKNKINNPIRIISGEGELGTISIYTGVATKSAIRRRLAKECHNGNRFARCEVLINGEWMRLNISDL